MVTNQPEWEYVDNLGDASPLDYGGAFLYRDKTGVYGFELERVELLDESDDESEYEIRRVCLDRCKVVDGVLVPYGYDATYPHPLKSYEEWFAKDLQRVADFVGSTKDALVADLCSDDGAARAGHRHAADCRLCQALWRL